MYKNVLTSLETKLVKHTLSLRFTKAQYMDAGCCWVT